MLITTLIYMRNEHLTLAELDGNASDIYVSRIILWLFTIACSGKDIFSQYFNEIITYIIFF